MTPWSKSRGRTHNCRQGQIDSDHRAGRRTVCIRVGRRRELERKNLDRADYNDGVAPRSAICRAENISCAVVPEERNIGGPRPIVLAQCIFLSVLILYFLSPSPPSPTEANPFLRRRTRENAAEMKQIQLWFCCTPDRGARSMMIRGTTKSQLRISRTASKESRSHHAWTPKSLVRRAK